MWTLVRGRISHKAFGENTMTLMRANLGLRVSWSYESIWSTLLRMGRLDPSPSPSSGSSVEEGQKVVSKVGKTVEPRQRSYACEPTAAGVTCKRSSRDHSGNNPSFVTWSQQQKLQHGWCFWGPTPVWGALTVDCFWEREYVFFAGDLAPSRFPTLHWTAPHPCTWGQH